MKSMLGIIGFFIIFYVVMVILILAGQAAMATFCTVLEEINLNRTEILDKIPLKFVRYNKIIIKECVNGLDGDLLKYAYMFQSGSNYAFNFDIQTIYPGITDYYKFISSYTQSSIAPSITSLISNYTSIMSGNFEDYPAVFDSALVIMFLSGSSNIVKVGSCTSGQACTSIAAGNSVSITNTANQVLITNIYNTIRNYLQS